MMRNIFTSESITMFWTQDHDVYSSFLLLTWSRQNCLLPTAFPCDVLSGTSCQDQQCWFLLDACVVSALSPRLSPAPRTTWPRDVSDAHTLALMRYAIPIPTFASERTTASTVTPKSFQNGLTMQTARCPLWLRRTQTLPWTVLAHFACWIQTRSAIFLCRPQHGLSGCKSASANTSMLFGCCWYWNF